MTHDIDVYCLTVIAYQIICTEMLGALDANLRNQMKISSRGTPEAATALAKPLWLPASTEAKKLLPLAPCFAAPSLAAAAAHAGAMSSLSLLTRSCGAFASM